MTQIRILDVGHGNCTIIDDNGKSAVIDSPTGSILIDTLNDLDISVVSLAIISHADKDHIAGILSLLTSEHIKVERIYVNPDGQKHTKIWEDFRVAVSVAERKGECEIFTSLSTTTPGTIKLDSANLTVVSPSAALALTGVGGMAPGTTKKCTSNTLSGVIKVNRDGNKGILFAGDMDDINLDDALNSGADLSADVLVFPHHGGLPGNDDMSAFLKKLLNAVNPSAVIFSNGRGRHDNPRLEVVRSVVEAGCSIACTQLSQRCQSISIKGTHLESIRAHGKSTGSCCAGSMTFTLDKQAKRIANALEQHQQFVQTRLESPMCIVR